MFKILFISCSLVCIVSAQCNEQMFSQCATTFMKNFGFNHVPSANQFSNALDKLEVNEGKLGFAEICSWNDAFYQCGGTAVFPGCMTVQNLESLGFSQYDATTYVELFENLAFSCGPGYQIIHDNFDCILKTNRTDARVLAKCGMDFVHGVQQHPEKTCQYAQEFVLCIGNDFTKSCGSVVGWAMCQQQERMLKVVLPQCDTKCH